MDAADLHLAGGHAIAPVEVAAPAAAVAQGHALYAHIPAVPEPYETRLLIHLERTGRKLRAAAVDHAIALDRDAIHAIRKDERMSGCRGEGGAVGLGLKHSSLFEMERHARLQQNRRRTVDARPYPHHAAAGGGCGVDLHLQGLSGRRQRRQCAQHRHNRQQFSFHGRNSIT